MYKVTIGMEIHVELKTVSKMFCACANSGELEKNPNINICSICTGQPGTLPVPNRQAIEFVQLIGLALNCKIARNSKFDRKNYFYPDLPKGYQISQYDQPLCEKGKLKIKNGKIIGITRIHLEEDTGKLLHFKGSNYTLVDFNRAGVPLMELVTEPDIESGSEARSFCQKLQQICRYLKVSDADMEKGHMRCEANISLYKESENRLSGVKVEVKNINSFKFVEKAIDYEIKRQTSILEKGGEIKQETRGYDSNRNITVPQRIKEAAHDYRYFPEPDIPPFSFTDEYIKEIELRLSELPEAKEKRLKEEYNLSKENVDIIVADRELAEYFENSASELKEKIKSGEIISNEEKCFRLLANYIANELQGYLNKNKKSIKDIKITPENYAELIGFLADDKINSSVVQIVLTEMHKTGGDPSHIIEEKNLLQINNEEEMEKVVQKVIDNNFKSVKDYQNGKQNALQFLMGQVMKESKGRANPQVIIKILQNKLIKK